MLFLRLAALSALNGAVSLAFLSSSAASIFAFKSILLLVVGNVETRLSFVLVVFAVLEGLPRLVVLELFTFPLPVRLCTDGRAPSVLRSSGAAEAGTEEWRRALRAALASSLIRVRGLGATSAGEESVKSNMSKLSFCSGSCLTMGFGAGLLCVLGSEGSIAEADVVVATFRFAVLVSLISAEIAFDVVDGLISMASGAGEPFPSWPVSFLSSFCLNGLPVSSSSSAARPEMAETGFQPISSLPSRLTVDLLVVEGAV